MNMKKTALASAMAMALATSSSVWALTSTVSGQFILDKTEVGSGDRVNLALLGLNAQGEVDRYGEKQGAVILASVKSEIGKVIGGSSTPGEDINAVDSAGNPIPAGGEFAATVSYVRLNQGNGEVNIYYPPGTSGTDTITVILQERYKNNTGGGVSFTDLTTATKTVVVKPRDTKPIALDITGFNPAPADPNGKGKDIDPIWMLSSGQMNSGVAGEMTAGTEGGQFTIEAKNAYAAGNVTLTLREKTSSAEPKTYTFTKNMVNGLAIVTLDNTVTKAATYYVEATFEGFDGNSVDLLYEDTVTVKPKAEARKVQLITEKKRIVMPASTFPLTSTPNACQGTVDSPVCQGTKVKAVLLDEYGNITSPTGSGATDIKLSIKDSEKVISDTTLDMYFPAGAAYSSVKTGDSIIGNNASEVLKLGTSKITATAIDSNNAPVSTIAPSDPLEIQAAADALLVTTHGDFAIGQNKLAGTEFNAFIIQVIDGAGAVKATDPGAITIKNITSKEEITVNRNTQTSIVQSLYKTQSKYNANGSTNSYGAYLVSDKNGNYGQTTAYGAVIETAASTQVKMKNAHGQDVTVVPPGNITTEKQYITTLYEQTLKMQDSYGNETTPDTGTYTVSSSNGKVAYTSPESDRGVPGRKMDYKATVTYDASGAKKFAGDDALAINFTKPGLGTNQLVITSPIPALKELKEIKTYIEQNSIPVNSQVAMTVEVLDQDGKIFQDPDPNRNTVITVTFNDQKGDDLNPIVQEIYATQGTVGQPSTVGVRDVVSGQAINFSETKGRRVFVIDAGAKEGQFSLTFKDANGTVTATRTFKVTRQLVDECSATNLGKCSEEVTCANAGGVFISSNASGTAFENACNAVKLLEHSEKGKSTKIGATGTQESVDAEFYGGVAIGNGAFEGVVKVTKDKGLTFAGNIKVAKEHVGKVADILFAVGIELPFTKVKEGSDPANGINPAKDFEGDKVEYDGSGDTIYKYLNAKGEPNAVNLYVSGEKWKDEVAKMTADPYKAKVTLGERVNVELWSGKLEVSGLESAAFYIFFGYALENGDIVYNSMPIIAYLNK